MTDADAPVFFDSSVLVEVLLGQPRSNTAMDLWDAYPRRLGSVLIEAECRTVLRRAARARAAKASARWLRRAESHLEEWLGQITLREVDRAVVDRLGSEPRLGGCRTLDALHLATALEYRDRLGGTLRVLTFDDDLAAVARDLGLAVAP